MTTIFICIAGLFFTGFLTPDIWKIYKIIGNITMDIWAIERTIKYLHFACRTFFKNVKQ